LQTYVKCNLRWFFFFDGLSKESDTTCIFGSNVTSGSVLVFPGLKILGISINRVDFAVGGVNPSHSHPSAIETVLIISRQVLVGFVTTENVYFSKVLTAGQIFIIPWGACTLPKECWTRERYCLHLFQQPITRGCCRPIKSLCFSTIDI